MREPFVNTIINYCNTPSTFFLTGDLGFMALEELQSLFKERFINCGIAEQNMVSVAAGLVKEGYRCFVYSIAPFIYARPYEQIRNDICFSKLPVCLVGNGGGYGYGHMGPTHHALEDCAAMHALGVDVLVPCFDEDIEYIVQDIEKSTYLRLGQAIKPKEFLIPSWAAWRCLLPGKQGVWVTLGPLSGIALEVLLQYPEEQRPALWACGAFQEPPPDFIKQVTQKALTVFEEHVAEGGLGMTILYYLAKLGISVTTFTHRYALRYPSHTFGSQNFHQEECGMGAQAMHELLIR